MENKMREVLFKNLTSLEKGRRVLSITEENKRNGYLNRYLKRFIYIVKEETDIRSVMTEPHFYIVKQHDTQQKEEKFMFKVKGNFYVVNNQKVFIVYFCHSFKIDLKKLPKVNFPKAS